MGGLTFPATQPKRPYLTALPNAEIRVEQHEDGRWMWAVSFATNQGGEGFAPLPKWRRFAQTYDAALSAGIDEMAARLSKRCWDGAHVEALRAWVESLRMPVQLDMFGEAS